MVETPPSNAGGAGSVPGLGAKILHASPPENQNIKQKQYCNKFNKDLMVHIKRKEKEKKLSEREVKVSITDSEPSTGSIGKFSGGKISVLEKLFTGYAIMRN